MQGRKENDKFIDYAVFTGLLFAAAGITLTLFYRQCVYNMQDSELYYADMKAYILHMQGLESGYSFPYPIFFKLAAFLHLFVSPELAVALATMFLNCFAIVVVKLSLNKMTLPSLKDFFAGKEWAAGVLISVLTLSLFWVSRLFPPEGIYLPGIRFKYLGVFSPNPFHNATYLAARPFAILAFLWCVRLLDAYEKGAQRRDYLLFTVFLLLATMTKPSFTIVLSGAVGLILLYRLFRRKCQNLKATFLFGLTFVPTFIDLLYQFQGVFVPKEGEEGGIGFCFGRIWKLYCDNIPLAVFLIIGFPVLVLAINHKQLKTDTLYRFSWQIFGMGFAMAFFLYEKGFREPDFNFSWGYMYGAFFAFLGALIVLVRATAKREKPLLLAVQWGAYLLHLLCGIVFFVRAMQGEIYF